MPSPDQFLDEIESLNIEQLEQSIDSIPEGKRLLKTTRQLQKELRQIKRRINLEMKSIRADYKDKIANAGSGASTLLTLFGKRKLAGQSRAEAKRQVRAERDNVLEPYERLKLHIDQLLVALDNVKLQINDFVEEVKAEEEQVKGESSSFCSECGASVQQSHKFCPNCGNRLD